MTDATPSTAPTPAPAAKRPDTWPRRIGRWLRRLGIGLFALVALLLVTVWWLLHSQFLLDIVGSQVLPRLNAEVFPGEIQVGALHGSLLGTLGLSDVVLVDPDGETVVEVDEVSLRWDLAHEDDITIRIHEALLQRARMDLQIGEQLNIARVFAEAGPEDEPEPVEEEAGGFEGVCFPLFGERRCLTFDVRRVRLEESAFTLHVAETEPEPDEPTEPDAPTEPDEPEQPPEADAPADGADPSADGETEAAREPAPDPAPLEGFTTVVHLEQIDVEAAYLLQGPVHHFELPSVQARAWVVGMDLGAVALRAEGSLDDVDLALRSAWVDALDSQIDLEGGVDLSGPVFDLRLASEALSLPGLEPVAALPLVGAPGLALDVQGPLSDLHATGTIRLPEEPETPRGELTLDVGLDVETPGLVYRAQLGLSQVEPNTVLDPELVAIPGPFTGSIQVEGAGTAFPDGIELDADIQLSDSSAMGIDIDQLDVEARLADGAATIERLRLRAPAARVDASGSADLAEERFQLVLDAAVPALERFRVFSAGIPAGRVEADLQVGGTWAGPIELAVVGDVDASVAPAGIQVGDVDADLDVEVVLTQGLPLLNGRVEADVSDVVINPQVSISRSRLEADLDGHDIDYWLAASTRSFGGGLVETRGAVNLDGDIDVATRSLEGEFRGLALRAAQPFAVTVGSAIEIDDLALESELFQVSADGRFAPSGDSDLTARVVASDLSALSDLLDDLIPSLSGSAQVDATVRGPAASPELTLDASTQALVVAGQGPLDIELQGGAGPGAVNATVEVGTGGEELVSADIGLPLAVRLNGAPVLDPEGVLDTTVTLADMPVSRLGAFLPALDGLSDLGRLQRSQITLGGPSWNPTLDGRVNLRGLDLDGDNGNQGDDLAPFNALLRIEGADAGLDIELELLQPRRVLVAESQAILDLGGVLLDALGPQGWVRPPELTPSRLPAVQKEGLARILPELSAQLQLADLRMPVLHALVPALRPLNGSLQGAITLGGELDSPIIDSSLVLRGGNLGGTRLAPITLPFHLEDGLMEVDWRIAAADGGGLDIDGTVELPLALDGSSKADIGDGVIALTLGGEGLPISLVTAFVDPQITRAEGDIRIDGGVSGTISAPEPTLSLALEDGILCHARTQVCYDDITLSAQADRSRFELAELSLQSNQIQDPHATVLTPISNPILTDRTLRLQADVQLEDFQPRHLSASIAGRNVWFIDNDEFSMRSGIIELSAEGPWPALAVRGELPIRRLRVNLGQEATRSGAQPLRMDPELVVHRGSQERVSLLARARGNRPASEIPTEKPAEEGSDEAAAPGIAESLDVDVLVSLEQDNRIQVNLGLFGGSGAEALLNTMARIAPDLFITGSTRVRMQEGRLTLTERIETMRGELSVLHRTFQVDRGNVIFTGASPPNPGLDLLATYTSNYGPIQIAVTGTATAPQVEFLSDQFEMPDILSILVTGQPLDALTSAESESTVSGAEQALGIVGGVIAKALPKEVGQIKLGLGLSESGQVGVRLDWGRALDPNGILFLLVHLDTLAEDGDNYFTTDLQLRLGREWFLTGFGGLQRENGAFEGIGGAELKWRRKW